MSGVCGQVPRSLPPDGVVGLTFEEFSFEAVETTNLSFTAELKVVDIIIELNVGLIDGLKVVPLNKEFRVVPPGVVMLKFLLADVVNPEVVKFKLGYTEELLFCPEVVE
jgi:hypothetical protein